LNDDHDDSAAPIQLDRYERAYGAHQFEVVQARYRKRMLLDLLARERPRTIVEVGCGLDSLANHWTEAERFVVVEPRAGFAADARAALAGRRDVEVIEDTLEGAAAALGGSHDLILLSGLLHEIEASGPLLDAVAALCGPATIVHANVPNANSFHRLLAVEMGLLQQPTERSDTQKLFDQPWIFTMESLKALLAAHGFAAFEEGSYFVKPFTHGQMQALTESGFMTPQMLEGLWGMARHMPTLGSEIFVNLRRV